MTAPSLTAPSLLDRIPLELGPAAYAEPFAADTFLKMPWNAVVNGLYLVVCAFWLLRLAKVGSDPLIAPWRGWFTAMALLGGIYGPIQFTRIVTQAPLSAVLDQWVTLPFFALVIAWNLELSHGRSPARTAALVLGSFASYGAVFLLADGFVAMLTLHLIGAVATSIATLRAGRLQALRPFMGALIGTIAFVVLKEGDLWLGRTLPSLFGTLTGHFWSKWGDAAQLHFALAFFEASLRAGVGRRS